MKKKVMLAPLLVTRLMTDVDTQIHAQDIAYLCRGYHSHMHSAMDGCLRMLEEQWTARDAAAKRQTEATQRRAQATRKQNASTMPTPDTTVQPEAVSTVNINSSQQPGSQTAQQVIDTASNPCPYRGDCDGIHQYNENRGGAHQLNENCSSGMQGYYHSEGRGQEVHHGSGNGRHGR